ncbi:MAG TPA: DMT family transporter [Gemmataceae bacterium]|jgi:drug/metabolite transporter (DMT)-like permease|nr:DMT family transporter [Gemmataceae bacterium]
MKTRSLYMMGVFLGFLSAMGSAVIAIVLAGEKQIPTNWVLLIQSSVALFVSCAAPVVGKIARIGRPPQDNEPMWLRTGRYGKHLLRAVAGLAIYGCYYQSLKCAPKVDCSLLLNTAPLFVPFLCIAAFGDRVPFRVWVGVVMGFIGVTVVLTPGASFKALEHGHLLALLAGLSFAWSTVLVRDLNRTEQVTTTVFYYNIHSVVCLLVVTAIIPQAVSWRDVAICFGVGLVFCVKQYAITLSVKLASASTAALLNFTAIPLLTLYGVFAEGKELSVALAVGAVLVAVGSLSAILKGRDPVASATQATEKCASAA